MIDRIKFLLINVFSEITLNLSTFLQLKAFQPKAPDSAYMLFCKAKRAKVHKQHPELNQKQVTTKLSIKWKEMTISQKVYGLI